MDGIDFGKLQAETVVCQEYASNHPSRGFVAVAKAIIARKIISTGGGKVCRIGFGVAVSIELFWASQRRFHRIFVTYPIQSAMPRQLNFMNGIDQIGPEIVVAVCKFLRRNSRTIACNFIGIFLDLDIIVLMEPINNIKVPHGSRKAESLPVPLPVERAITKLGNDLALARRRRRISQESLAIRIGASLSTVKRMEKGDMRIPLHFIARTLHVFGELERLTALIDTAKDDIGLTLADEQLPQRVRRKTRHAPTGAL